MDVAEVRRSLEETQALLNGHFLLSSGKHSDKYFQCARVLASPARASLLGAGIGSRFTDLPVDAVIGPAIGGIVIAHEVARYLGTPSYYTERENGNMTLRRGFTLEPGSKVIVVEDVVTTGGSAKEVVELFQSMGIEVVGVGAIVWRSPEPNASSPFGALPFRPLLVMPTEAWDVPNCPQCKLGKPFHKPGSRTHAAGAAAEAGK
ncbi:MAG: orotate phosphoribosyltransferase [Planctomycetes bacterium]|nr:orotate phosphoribosyltransferase [Planctomycetota bacterium]